MVTGDNRAGLSLRSPRYWLMSLLLALTLLFSAGCQTGSGQITIPGVGSVNIGGGAGNGEATAPTESGWRTVPLRVVEGPEGQVLALVPVFINGQGPYPFALDTGASQSLIDQQLVEQLNLEVTGSAGPVTGVGGQTTAEIVRVEDWQLGEISLNPASVTTLDLGGGQQQSPIAGLLGSDVLSSFGVVTVDYESQELRLKPRS